MKQYTEHYDEHYDELYDLARAKGVIIFQCLTREHVALRLGREMSDTEWRIAKEKLADYCIDAIEEVITECLKYSDLFESA